MQNFDYRQPQDGYRFSRDAVLLANFIISRPGEKVLDLGAGCGVVGLEGWLNGRLDQPDAIFFVEFQAELYTCLSENLRQAAPKTPIKLTGLKKDWRELSPEDFGGELDYIFINPPYFKAGANRPNPNPGLKLARHEAPDGLLALFKCLISILKPDGRLAIIFPAERQNELEQTMASHRFKVTRFETHGRLILIEATFNPGV